MLSPNVELIEIFASNILNGIGLAPSDIALIPKLPQVMLIVISFWKALGFNGAQVLAQKLMVNLCKPSQKKQKNYLLQLQFFFDHGVRCPNMYVFGA